MSTICEQLGSIHFCFRSRRPVWQNLTGPWPTWEAEGHRRLTSRLWRWSKQELEQAKKMYGNGSFSLLMLTSFYVVHVEGSECVVVWRRGCACIFREMTSNVLTRPSALRPSNLSEGNSIQTMLNTIGVKYSHHNDEVLLPSRIEEERTKKTLMACRSRVALSKYILKTFGTA